MSRAESVTSSSSSMASPPTSSAQLRKIKKPLIERRRRERINICLTQLKSLVLEALNKNESCYSKMEKADILEMTVAHLKNVHQSHPRTNLRDSALKDPDCLKSRYVSGFRECASEVQKYLNSTDLTDCPGARVKYSLFRYLENRLEEFQKYFRNTLDYSDVSLLPSAALGGGGHVTVSGEPKHSQRSARPVPKNPQQMKHEQTESFVAATSPPHLFVCDNPEPVCVKASSSPCFSLSTKQMSMRSAPTIADDLRSSNACIAKSATNDSTTRRLIQSPSEGDEFPRTVAFKYMDSEIAAAQFFCSPESKGVHTNETAAAAVDQSGLQPADDMWRPWTR